MADMCVLELPGTTTDDRTARVFIICSVSTELIPRTSDMM